MRVSTLVLSVGIIVLSNGAWARDMCFHDYGLCLGYCQDLRSVRCNAKIESFNVTEQGSSIRNSVGAL